MRVCGSGPPSTLLKPNTYAPAFRFELKTNHSPPVVRLNAPFLFLVLFSFWNTAAPCTLPSPFDFSMIFYVHPPPEPDISGEVPLSFPSTASRILFPFTHYSFCNRSLNPFLFLREICRFRRHVLPQRQLRSLSRIDILLKEIDLASFDFLPPQLLS